MCRMASIGRETLILFPHYHLTPQICILLAMAFSLLKSGAALSALTLLSRVLGLAREMTKARFLGTSALSDAFTVAFVIPNLLRRLFAENSISVAFIPTFRNYLAGKSKGETREFLSACFTFITFAVSLVVVAGIAITPLIVPFFGTAEGETVLLTRIMFPYLALISIAAFFQGILNGVKVFLPSGFTPILFNLCVIGFTWALKDLAGNPARAMAIGVTVGGLVQAAFQLPFVLRAGYRFSFVSIKKAFHNKGTRNVLRLVGPTIFGMAAYQLNDLVSTILAGNADEGVVSSLQYSLRLQELILGVFAVTIGTVILPDLSGLAAKRRWRPFNEMLLKAISVISLLCIPVSVFACICAEDLIRLLFEGRSFAADSVALTAGAFRMHTIGLFFIAANRVISPAFYAQQDTKSPTAAGIASFALNIAFALILAPSFSGRGIALALSIASAANTVLLFIMMKRREGFDQSFLIKSSIGYAAKIALFSAIAGALLYALRLRIIAMFAGLAGLGRVIEIGAPLAACAVFFAAAGLLLLALSRDKLLLSLLSSIIAMAKKKNKASNEEENHER